MLEKHLANRIMLLTNLRRGQTPAAMNHGVGAKHSGDKVTFQPRFFYPNASPFLGLREGEAFGNRYLDLPAK